TQLTSVSKSLAEQASRNLYDVGIQAAQGLVDALASKQSEIAKAMERIADEMIRAIRTRLKIKSPSRIFTEIGKFSMLGLVRGFTDTSSLVTNAASNVTDDALSAMQKSLRDISNVLVDTVDFEPTITPVLDLSNVRSGAKQLDRMMNVIPITAAASFNQASTISASQIAAATAQTDTPTAQPTQVKFEQNNYSPESLTPSEVYRQTRNQLAQAKTLLGIPAA
ncbi:MAG TPA: hypothetical protein VN843_31825, partial [Anaerolineales bacterium]|nr:hypothetical protein [Anaerolineales bacterium]